ncbi:hypothetical protein AMJ85_11815 [candidate division BRC1 bacterium SM23_51]|nr:MAG: hypothetical protein AMJ85_11815 [candidate division BRC1 bacterium SM23_51]
MIRSKEAFTLIELLIVVAIIAILALIAVPNFLEAQTRAKVSRTNADMRSLSVALEAYCVDYDNYPIGKLAGGQGDWIYPLSGRLKPLTTPVAYIATIPPDPFPVHEDYGAHPVELVDTFDYTDHISHRDRLEGTRGCVWRMASGGPDMRQTYGEPSRGGVDYDPTNGTVSNGDIVRTGAKRADYRPWQ